MIFSVFLCQNQNSFYLHTNIFKSLELIVYFLMENKYLAVTSGRKEVTLKKPGMTTMIPN